jgi:hypothetical protein
MNRQAQRVTAEEVPSARWRARLHEIIFEADTPAGRFFDFALIWLIILSVGTVVLESVRHVREQYGALLYTLEWAFTVLFYTRICVPIDQRAPSFSLRDQFFRCR